MNTLNKQIISIYIVIKKNSKCRKNKENQLNFFIYLSSEETTLLQASD